MTKKKTMRILGVGMMALGVGLGAFGVSMRSTWQSSAQVPKVYDWNSEGLGEAPAIDDSDDIQVDKDNADSGTGSVDGENEDKEAETDETSE